MTDDDVVDVHVRCRAELARAIETRENANTVSVRVELENARLRAAIESIVALRECPEAAVKIAATALHWKQPTQGETT